MNPVKTRFLFDPVQLNSVQLEVAKALDITLQPQSDVKSKGIRVVPDWYAIINPLGSNLFVGYRDKTGKQPLQIRH